MLQELLDKLCRYSELDAHDRSSSTPDVTNNPTSAGTSDQDHEISRQDPSQTDGEPLPELTPEPLTGQAPAARWAALAKQVGAHGYRIERGDCRGANGYTDPAGRLVRIRADVEEAMAARVLAHELAHLECGHCEHGGYRCRGRCEVEAESIADVVAAAHGLDASGYSSAYAAGWAGGDLTHVRQAAETVTKAARTILGHCSVDTATAPEPGTWARRRAGPRCPPADAKIPWLPGGG